jgi:hypothetical protein
VLSGGARAQRGGAVRQVVAVRQGLRVLRYAPREVSRCVMM